MTIGLIPSHEIAGRLMKLVDRILDLFHLEHHTTLEEIIYTIVVIAIAAGIGWVIRRGIVGILRKAIALRKTQAGADLLQQRTITKCSHIIPPLIFMALIPVAFQSDAESYKWIMRIAGVYTLLCFAWGLNAVITFLWTQYDNRHNTENHPLRGILNVLHGIVWIVIVIIGVSILINKSPMALLGGLGAFAAALMLIFKDSILGFVAGIQLSNNDMLRVGDWIVVPSTQANGTVIEVTLTVVKVQNWDNTIIMLPPYTLVSTSFQNWRGMQDSGARRIMRSVIIDNNTIAAPTPELIASIEAKYPKMAEYIESRQKLLAEGKGNIYDPANGVVNGSVETNLGIFRAYLCQYMIDNPSIDKSQNMMVRTLEATEVGTPLQIYCFSNNTKWIAYEAIMSEMFEHIAIVAADFGLTIFNSSDGNSMDIDLYDKTPKA
ncbi:MAG: mechanosensitive ion channel family protein [Muribaculaceae bacterium]|nr:mechanosensitive ion channel family protein [Muribaculaceae bacterium]